ncbi:hypothetical protein INT43_005104 [Umbelopsis isabellina]|uniref:EamA domain-containing protein n=1 Tax=Mortierella isabellina TaxID=91625 RepID=A0A8H7PGR7_MORIS|nr:hypothetical protein INT43_005104 [Umbelopsis isabellina]
MSFIPPAIASGTFAALASVFAKLFTDEKTSQFTQSTLELLPISKYSETAEFYVSSTVRIICFILIFGCNSLMWTIFTKALNRAPSSTAVSIVNSAANFSVSALAGYIVFGEPLALSWWVGATLIITGTLILTRANSKMEETKSKAE